MSVPWHQPQMHAVPPKVLHEHHASAPTVLSRGCHSLAFAPEHCSGRSRRSLALFGEGGVLHLPPSQPAASGSGHPGVWAAWAGAAQAPPSAEQVFRGAPQYLGVAPLPQLRMGTVRSPTDHEAAVRQGMDAPMPPGRAKATCATGAEAAAATDTAAEGAEPRAVAAGGALRTAAVATAALLTSARGTSAGTRFQLCGLPADAGGIGGVHPEERRCTRWCAAGAATAAAGARELNDARRAGVAKASLRAPAEASWQACSRALS
mmetsp:Transcript_103709/g.334334  ORF Transcript_103709/g.334334 Transcript_103709/m.334334 type:complete len:263 (+) Transcript_103709:2-790(+)